MSNNISKRILKHLDKFSLIRDEDLKSILKLGTFPDGSIILDVGCQTGKSTALIAEQFPKCTVIGIESNDQMFKYANQTYSPMVNFIHADITESNFIQQIQSHKNGQQLPFADFVITVHSFYVSNPKMDNIIKNIKALLNKNGKLYAMFSFWTDLIQTGQILTEKMRAQSLFSFQNQQPVDVTKPNLKDDMIRMKQLLQINQFGSSPKITIEYCKMRFYTLKRIQDCIQGIYLLNLMVPEIKRLEFFNEFFERFYNGNFEDTNHTSASDILFYGYFFAYQYLFVKAVNMGN